MHVQVSVVSEAVRAVGLFVPRGFLDFTFHDCTCLIVMFIIWILWLAKLDILLLTEATLQEVLQVAKVICFSGMLELFFSCTEVYIGVYILV